VPTGKCLRALILSVAADGVVLIAAIFPESAERADVWFEPVQSQPTIYRSLANTP
jgi:hypothetical protein